MGAKGQRGGRGMESEFGVSRWKLLHLEWIKDKVLLHSTRNCIQSPGINHNGKEYKKESIHVYNGVTAIEQKLAQYRMPTILQQKNNG